MPVADHLTAIEETHVMMESVSSNVDLDLIVNVARLVLREHADKSAMEIFLVLRAISAKVECVYQDVCWTQTVVTRRFVTKDSVPTHVHWPHLVVPDLLNVRCPTIDQSVFVHKDYKEIH